MGGASSCRFPRGRAGSPPLGIVWLAVFPMLLRWEIVKRFPQSENRHSPGANVGFKYPNQLVELRAPQLYTQGALADPVERFFEDIERFFEGLERLFEELNILFE